MFFQKMFFSKKKLCKSYIVSSGSLTLKLLARGEGPNSTARQFILKNTIHVNLRSSRIKRKLVRIEQGTIFFTRLSVKEGQQEHIYLSQPNLNLTQLQLEFGLTR